MYIFLMYVNVEGNILMIKNEESLFCKGKAPNIKRFMEISLLLLLAQEESHGYTLAERLNDFGFSNEEFNIGTLYRTLRKMEKDNYVTSKWLEGGQGPKKRVYQITESGKNTLAQLIEMLKSRKKRIERLIDDYDSLKINWLKPNRKEG
jgi:PadR family transcriptional regulator PadR